MKAIVLLILILTSVCRTIADDGKSKTGISPAQKLSIIQQKYKKDQAAYWKATGFGPPFVSPKSKSQVKEWNRRFDEEQTNLFAAAVELAKANPKSQVGFAALNWMLQVPDSYFFPASAQALKLMSRQYAANPEIGNGIAVLAHYLPGAGTNLASYTPAMNLLHAVAARNPNRAVRGQAALGLANFAQWEFQSAEDEANPDANRLAAKAERAFEVVQRNYADIPYQPMTGFTLGDQAKRALFELRHLRVGQVAPEIKGEDLDGVPMKLSDYRGKVVLLVFWASWCGPCMREVPQEKALVEHFKGRPFAVVGVSGDWSRSAARKAVLEHEIPWRSFWDGHKGSKGPIALTWNVKGWPTDYVLDQNGVIRVKDFPFQNVEAALEKLISAAEKQ